MPCFCVTQVMDFSMLLLFTTSLYFQQESRGFKWRRGSDSFFYNSFLIFDSISSKFPLPEPGARYGKDFLPFLRQLPLSKTNEEDTRAKAGRENIALNYFCPQCFHATKLACTHSQLLCLSPRHQYKGRKK